MGSEQSAQLHQQQVTDGAVSDGSNLRSGNLHRNSGNDSSMRSTTSTTMTCSKLQRGNTIAVSGSGLSSGSDPSNDRNSLPLAGVPSSPYICDSRPVSPPMSVCSDSELPYISYTDKPIGDSPKLRNKQQAKVNSRPNSTLAMNRSAASQPEHIADLLARGGRLRTRPLSGSHNIVVVKSAIIKEVGIEKDDDILRLKSVPMFLPVMRGTLSLPAIREPDVLERLQQTHLVNMCSRLQLHFNTCALHVSSEQQQITNSIKEVDQEISSALAQLVQKQKLYTSYAETFSKIRLISQQLTRCNDILNQNIESMEYLNNLLNVEERLEPFVWKT
ncbi:BLOC-1-related complex subunit 5 isoform X1 [Anopheles darlingi]|uniref:BLOC-1-related complex subunit 5 n=2 Tax=Anopheles darlingi TaxID=43151 RepID=A0A2M4CIF1_ANODA|nr:BLOC-1-related complex subunit 5 isoform X1 [Anopheles darlingi]XP_049536590.1 BLOC-1-related complex subunit 5 isoform X1 [Anopheles darlingi]XP_049536597.1 BLOC-1-related complex subunit 5 isoform X1 [Anopheles darlingi]XP_049536605.1 BLOC-1-related complex subunit 5 isoform X1 [Anopheles darlingi]XP_049536612.1 BLOC-1-related complex subunit 5 isoform X1 [Anopheles darlingi]XP_049536620.1 BLOC-1-related complex subunit 5 isoform X1 [Anopheles darlingi]XP_049536628.1 BLOC-1-related compl